MDKYNLFFTRGHYNLERLDWAVIMLIALALTVLHYQQVNWWAFTIAFLMPDLIATFPGLYIYYARRSGEHRSIPGIIHKLYNFGHNFAVVTVASLIWAYLGHGFEWAMLAFPIHLGGDRSIFGNIYKPLETSFEAVEHQAFSRFKEEIQTAGDW